MQTKSSYRALKWMFLVGSMATLGTACVVTSGDGGDGFGEGGEGGTDTTTAGKNSTSGSGGSATAGTSTGGTSAGGTSAGGTGDGGTSDGGEPSSYVPGVCEDSLMVPSMPRDATVTAADDEFPCLKCLKVQCEAEWSTCYGEAPTSACGSGSTEAKLGQFECIHDCFLNDKSGDDAQTVLGTCESGCLDQCEDDGFATTDTQDLLGCGQDKCLVECFTPE